jgi:uncharacterized protein YbcC (UPF0753/DUF2309 family)
MNKNKTFIAFPVITHLVQDACGACANAASCFGANVKIILCFFHLQKNVKERLKNQDEQKKSEIIKDVKFHAFL